MPSITLTPEELARRRARFQPKVGDRVTYIIPDGRGWSYGFGDVIKLNRTSVRVVDCKFPGETHIVVDRGLLTSVKDQSELITLTLTHGDEDEEITSLKLER